MPIPASSPPDQANEAPPITADVKHVLQPDCQAAPETAHELRAGLVRTFSTSSRRPSAAAGCGRLASLAVLAGQHHGAHAHGNPPTLSRPRAGRALTARPGRQLQT